MKKTMIFAAFAALISLAFTSCQKEELTGSVKNNPSAASESPVFTATIEARTKTTIDAATGKVSWETTDEITVSDASKNSAVYKITSIDATSGKATFEHKSGTALGDGPYTATYGNAPATEQKYSATPGQLNMTAQSETTSLTFQVQCGLMEINLTKTGENVKSIAVTGTPTGGSETTYTLTCTEPQDIEAGTSFYISVAEGNYNKIVITDSEDKVCTLTAASGITVEANHIKPLIFADSKLHFIPAGALVGVFTVDPGYEDESTDDDVKVHFSKGNLIASINESGTPTDWKFATNQYDYIGYNVANISIGNTEGDVDLFGWSTYAEFNNWGIYAIYDATEDLYGGEFRDWGEAYCGSKGIDEVNTWRTLSEDEWYYLLYNRTVNGSQGEGHSFKIAGVKTDKGELVEGLILFPDNYPGPKYDNPIKNEDWKKMEKAGCVFLPCAGMRDVEDVFSGYGYYWSSTNKSDYNAYNLFFDNQYAPEADCTTERWFGISVRLVTVCQ